ncbi:transmembrane protein 163 [Ascaphus truei]|uniref:transmembrane protein 163 n=1 Tax=Ascaphus truei TaxID=8439 RepID=UPI003F5A2792
MDPFHTELGYAPDPSIVQPSCNGQAPPAHPGQAPPAHPEQEPTQMDREQQMKMSESAQFSDGVENRGLLESSTKLKPHEAQNYRKKALWVSWISIGITLVLAVAAFRLELERTGTEEPSELNSAMCSSGDPRLLRYWSTILINMLALDVTLIEIFPKSAILAFRQPPNRKQKLINRKLNNELKDTDKDTDNGTKPHFHFPFQDDFLFSVSIISGILCSLLAVVKFMLGRVLTSRALITDGFNSLVGGIMGFSILLSAEVFKNNPSVWYLDGSTGILIGLIIMAYGVKLLVDMVPRVRQTRHYEMFE